jgi:hypothetical protein
MRNESPRKSEHAGIAFKWSFREFWQLAIETAREIVPDLANLFLRDMKVVDQPFRRWRDRAFLTDRGRYRPIRFEQHSAIVAQPLRQPSISPGLRRDTLSCREALGMLFEALDAEQLGPNWLLCVLDRGHRRTLERAKD